jgi:hypothetical protein
MNLAREPQPDWSHRESVACLVDSIEAENVVEVGVYRGHLMHAVLERCPTIQAYFGVDPFVPYRDQSDVVGMGMTGEGVCNAVMRDAETVAASFDDRAHLMVMASVDAARLFGRESVDLVFIDGNHRYDQVVFDIGLWLPAVRRGGILAGRDYAELDEVTRAVDDVLKGEGFDVKHLPDAAFASHPGVDWLQAVWYIEV